MQKVKLYVNQYQSQLLYLIFGGLTTVINVSSFAIMYDMWLVNLSLATAIAWVLSVLFAYLTNRVWVFGSKARGFKAIFLETCSFFFFRGLTFILDLGIMQVGVGLLHGNAIGWKIIDNIIIVLINYVLSKVLIFREKK